MVRYMTMHVKDVPDTDVVVDLIDVSLDEFDRIVKDFRLAHPNETAIVVLFDEDHNVDSVWEREPTVN